MQHFRAFKPGSPRDEDCPLWLMTRGLTKRYVFDGGRDARLDCQQLTHRPPAHQITYMPGEDLITDLKSRGGDVTTLAALARADDKSLQQTLKALGYLKLGERARVLTALKAVPEVLDVSDAAAPSTAPEDDDEPVGDSTMVMHGAGCRHSPAAACSRRRCGRATRRPARRRRSPNARCVILAPSSRSASASRPSSRSFMGEQQVCGTRAESCSTAPSASHPHLLLFHLYNRAQGHGEVREHHAKRRDL